MGETLASSIIAQGSESERETAACTGRHQASVLPPVVQSSIRTCQSASVYG